MEIKDGISDCGTETVHSFLMIGQSNMAGRGEFADVLPIKNSRCLMLRMGRWQPMSEPLNPDREIFSTLFHSGISLGASFADEATQYTEGKIGMIPCADGGTRIDQWKEGSILFDHAVMMTRLAMRTSHLAGILWHQGESDCHSDEEVAAYKDKLSAFITGLRRALGVTVPFVIGELSHSYSEKYGCHMRSARMNEIFREIARELPLVTVVSSEGLSMKPDGLHFDAASLRTFGRRYYAAYAALVEEAR